MRVKALSVGVDNGNVTEQGSLSVTWMSYVVPWVAMRVVVDIWLGTEPAAPPTRSIAVPAEPSESTDSEPSGLWRGRRAWIPVFAAAVVLWSVAAVRTSHLWSRLLDVALIIAAGHRGYAYWTDPLPPGYADRLRNEPRFGAKLWHKLAIAFLAVFVLFVVAALVGLVK